MRTRAFVAAVFLCAPATAQTPVPVPKPVIHAKPVAMPSAPLMLAKALTVNDADRVTVEMRVLTVSGKESRAAVAKLFKAKDQEKTAFLTDTELKAVLEKCAADRTTTVMQAPRIAATAGEPATVAVCENKVFTTAWITKVVGDEVVLVGQNEAMETGTTFTAIATPSADGKFVKLKVSFRDKQPKAVIPQLAVTTFITPKFADGSKGRPIPYKQFVQVPAFDEVKVDRTATLPNGGTMAIPVGTRTVVTKIESKVPAVVSVVSAVLGDIPYLNRMFRNTTGREEECDVVVFATATRVKEAAKVEPPKVLLTATGSPAEFVVGTRAVASVVTVPAGSDEVTKLVAAYHKACAAGKKDEAARLAVQALAKDPTCFGR